MIFITKNNIFELSDWELKNSGNYTLPTVFHDFLSDIIPNPNNSKELYDCIMKEIEDQIIKNQYYVDFQKINLSNFPATRQSGDTQ